MRSKRKVTVVSKHVADSESIFIGRELIMWALNVILSLLLLHYYSNVVAKHFLIETKGQDLGSDYAASVKDVKGTQS